LLVCEKSGLARQHRLSAYDAAYLDLAKREALPLATLDANLQQAALALDIPVIT
jgi:predicted nucleic acid-binding protein